MKKFNYFLSTILLVFSVSCDDVLEEDITNDDIKIVSPLSDTTIEGNNVQFSWNYLDGADSYRIQILNNNQVNVLDSLVTSNVFSYVLNSGTYQWRLRGENFAYATAYSFPVDFSVEASEDLSNQTLQLQTPSSSFYTNDANILFTWKAIETAEAYSYELQRNLNGLETIFQENDAGTSLNLNILLLDEDAEYIWKVKATNSTSETDYTERSFFLDREVPNQPSLVSPIDMEITNAIVNFNWTNGVDVGNVQSDLTNTVEIGNDVNFNSILTTETTINNEYRYIFSDVGIYYWRVKVTDAANNTSEYSTVTSLTVE